MPLLDKGSNYFVTPFFKNEFTRIRCFGSLLPRFNASGRGETTCRFR